jgi:hypothetical protein
VGDGVGAWPPRALRSYAELFALAGLAITQPVLDVFGRAPDFFVYREASRAGLVAFAVLVAVLPAAVPPGSARRDGERRQRLDRGHRAHDRRRARHRPSVVGGRHRPCPRNDTVRNRSSLMVASVGVGATVAGRTGVVPSP